jgi:hypothetical protein
LSKSLVRNLPESQPIRDESVAEVGVVEVASHRILDAVLKSKPEVNDSRS